MAKDKPPTEARLSYRLTLSFENRVVYVALMDEVDKHYLMRGDERILPAHNCWQHVEGADGPHCWITFEMDEPFNPQEVERVQRKIEILDAAAHVMIHG